jgi:hypothetical protein
MMPRAFYLASMAFAFWPLPASAQPLFRQEHNWTISVNEHPYGLRQVWKMPGDTRLTQVWLGRYMFNMKGRAEEVVALVLLAPADPIPKFWCLVEWGSLRCLD